MVRKIVSVIWHDAHSGEGTWQNISDINDPDPYVCYSVGYLLDVNNGGKKKHLSIAQSISDCDAVDSILHIPNAMVQKVVDLTEIQPQEALCIVPPVKLATSSDIWSGSRPEV